MPDRVAALLIGSEIYRGSSYGPWHPLRIPRVSTVMDLARALGWLPPERFRASPRAKPAALRAWHTADYVATLERAEARQAVSEGERERHGLGTTANPVFPEMYRRPATGVGGVMLAAELLAGGGAVHVPNGGTHHAFPDRANRFCYLNDPVFAVRARRPAPRRVAYVDIDAHHCDGVEHAFRDDPGVLVLSTHEEGRWPRTGSLADRGLGNLWNLPVPRDFHDDDMARVREEVILPAVEAHRPDAIVLQCGADGVPRIRRRGLKCRTTRMSGCSRACGLLRHGSCCWAAGATTRGRWGDAGRGSGGSRGVRAAGAAAPRSGGGAAGPALGPAGWGRMVEPAEGLVTTLADPWRGGVPTDGVAERVAALRVRLRAWA